jgi:hypothetical protein
MGVMARIMCIFPYAMWFTTAARIVEASTAINREMLKMCCRNVITGLKCAALRTVDVSSICKAGRKLGISVLLTFCPYRDHPSFSTAEFGYAEGTCNYPVYFRGNFT